MKSKILRLKDSLNNDLKGDTERKIQKYLKNNNDFPMGVIFKNFK